MVNPWDRTFEQRIESCQEKKDLGSDKFKEHDYKAAGKYYIDALKDIIPLIEPPSELDSAINSLKVACYSNLAACQLKLGQYQRVIFNCDKSLFLDNNNVKSLFRRASAYLEYKGYDEAEKDIQAILQLEPNNTATRELETKLKRLLSDRDKADAKMMKAFMQEDC